MEINLKRKERIHFIRIYFIKVNPDQVKSANEYEWTNLFQENWWRREYERA